MENNPLWRFLIRGRKRESNLHQTSLRPLSKLMTLKACQILMCAVRYLVGDTLQGMPEGEHDILQISRDEG